MLKSDIENLNNLTCIQCKDRFVEPKLLPCGASLCNYCITVTIFENPIEFKCIHCKRIHQVPMNGTFPLNEDLNKKLLVEQVLSTEFTEIKKEIEKKLNKLEFNIVNGEYVIKEYTREVRRQVQLAKEIKIEQINNISDDLIKKIDDFEKEHLENNSNKCWKNQELNMLNNEINEIKNGITHLNDQIDSAKDLQSQLALCQENLHSLLFDNRSIEFIQHIKLNEDDQIGSLSYGTFDEIDFNSLNRISFESYIATCDRETSRHNSVFTCLCLENDEFLIMIYKAKSLSTYNIEALLFDENKVFKKSELLEIDTTNCRSAVIKSNRICFDFDHKRNSYLYIIDYDLNFLKRICIDKQRLVGSNDSFIYLANNRDLNTSPIKVYDWSFQLVKQIGHTNNANDPFYFSNIIYIFNNENGKYNLVEGKYLKIIDEKTGHIDKSIELKGGVDLFGIDSDNRLIVATDKKLMYLNQKGVLLKEIKFLDHPDKYEFHWNLDKNNNFLIFNAKINQLLIKKKIVF